MMKKIENLVGPVEWVNDVVGYCRCPGEILHTKPHNPRECRIYLDKVPTIHCVHQSCAEMVTDQNYSLRQALRGAGWDPPPMTEDVKQQLRDKRVLEAQARRLEMNRDLVLEKYAWPVDEISLTSLPITSPWQQFLGLWEEDDIVWMGDPWHSGKPVHAANFKPIGEWKAHSDPPHNFTCGSIFKPESFARTKDMVQSRRFIIIECDTLDVDPIRNQDLSGAVLNYVRQQGWTLRAIVTSGNKSIHGWFDYQDEAQEKWARTVLPALKVDPATIRPTQPVRVAGIQRDNGNFQELLWVN